MKENDRVDRLAGKSNYTGLRLGRSELLRSSRHYLQAQSQGHHTIDHQRKKDDLPWKDEKGQSSMKWTLKLFHKQRCENFWEMGWSAYWLIRAHRFYLEFTWYTDHYQTRSSNQAIHWKLDCWWYMCCLSIILMQLYMKIQIWFKMNLSISFSNEISLTSPVY